ncbi:hypothetical protein Neosp_009942 [[Neocosmospora] mangrovei]
MTGRGKAGTPAPPRLPPRDLTLTTRLVLQERFFDIRSVGPGAAFDIRSTAESLHDLKDRAGHFSDSEECGQAWYLLRKLRRQSDPTWGYYVFVNSYTEAAMNGLEPAAQKLVKVAHRIFAETAHPALSAETYKRFKLDLVQDREVLNGASDDCVREEFNALLRGHGLWPAGCSDSGPFMPAHHFVCFVFDEAAILELESLSFLKTLEEGYKALKNVRIKIADRAWQRPKSGRATYPGVDDYPVKGLFKPGPRWEN